MSLFSSCYGFNVFRYDSLARVVGAVLFIATPAIALGAPSVRNFGATNTTATLQTNPTTVRSGILTTPKPVATKSVSGTAGTTARMPTSSGGVFVGIKPQKVTSSSSAAFQQTVNALETLQKNVDLLQKDYATLASYDYIDSQLADARAESAEYITNALADYATKSDLDDTKTESMEYVSGALVDYAKKTDFDKMRFAVQDDDVKYSIDDGATWRTVAPVSTFAGEDGADGESAYEIWKKAGNSGTQEDFLASLKGEQGDKGDTGDKGEPGAAGRDACTPTYTSALDTDGNTLVTITCADDPTKVLGTYSVARGADGKSPCDELRLEKDETYTEPGVDKYMLMCIKED